MLYDIIIIGGGMVGASLARALSETPFRIALVDATKTTAEDPRLIALNHGSHCLFKNLGVWSAMEPYATAIKQIHVSEKSRFGMTRLSADDVGMHALGYVVPAKHINAALTLSNAINIFRPAKLKKLLQNSSHATLTLETESGEEIIEGKIIVGADGSYSTVRELINMETEIVDYHQSAIVTITELQRHHQHIAYERFHATGAIAMLPLDEKHAATIWSDKNENITSLMQQSDEDFLQTLQKQFGYRLGKLQKINQRHVFPLKMLRAKQHVKERVILIGNALHTLHPIAAQGLNLALYEIAKLTDYFKQQNPETISLNNPPDFSWQQKLSSRLSHRLAQLFLTDLFIINFGRQLGMIGLDLFPAIKRNFIQRAIGKAGHTPELLLEPQGYS